MTEIEVPDWVAAVALDAYKASRGSYEGEVPPDLDDIRAALTAALGAWVVPVGQADTMPGTVGFTAAVFKTIDVGVAQPLYTLRQEKPE